MLEKIGNKWDIKHIQILAAPTKGAMEKVSISKKFTQCKTSGTLKIDVFKIPDNNYTGKLFSKYDLLLLDQANSSSNPSQILIKLRCLHHHFCQILPKPSEIPFQHNAHHIFHRFPYFTQPHSTTCHHKYWI